MSGIVHEKPQQGKLLCIHIGTHRTGTTSLQKFLVQNADTLADAGWHVVTDPYRRKAISANLISLSNAILRTSLKTRKRVGGRASRPWPWVRRRVLRRFRQIIEDAPADRLILSAEAFCFCRTDKEERRLLELTRGHDVRVVVTFRDDAEWRRSRASQFPPGSPIDRLRKRVPDANMIDGEWYFDKTAIADFWQKIGDLRVVDYERAVAERGSTVPAVLEAMGVDGIDARDVPFHNTSAEKRARRAQAGKTA